MQLMKIEELIPHKRNSEFFDDMTGENKVDIKKNRDKILQAHNNCCDICNLDLPEILVIHHVVSEKKGGDNQYSNLMVVCPNCFAILRKLRIGINGNKELFTENLEKWIDNHYSKNAGEKIDHWIKLYIQNKFKYEEANL